MKLESRNADISGKLGMKSTKAKLSEKDMQKMYELIQEPYKNPVGAIVREYTSNAFDAHKEIGVDDAVIVKLGRNDHLGYYFKVVDVGVGLSTDRMEHVFMNIFASTKEDSNEMIGAFGMGSKAGISYSPFFMINTHYDGVTYKYQYRKGQLEPELDLLEQYDEANKRNGSEFIVPIKNEEDLFKFVAECKRQLYYFTNVVFDIAELKNALPDWQYEDIKESLDDDYKIYEGKTFKARISKNANINSPFTGLHMAIGPVSYPIDSGNFDIPHKLNFESIALKFDIGELDIIQTREDVKYTEKTFLALETRLKDFEEELLDLVGRDKEVIHTKFKEYKEALNQTNTLTLGKGEYTMILHSRVFPQREHKLKAFHDICPEYRVPVDMMTSCYDGFQCSELIRHSGEGMVRISTGDFYEHWRAPDGTTLGAASKGRYLTDFQSITQIVKADIPFVFKDKDTPNSVKKNKQLMVGNYDMPVGSIIPIFTGKHPNKLDYFKRVLRLDTVPKDKWRDIIKVFQSIRKKVFDIIHKDANTYNYENIKIDEPWLATYNKKYRKTSERDNTKISAMYRGYSWENENETLHELCYPKGILIYTEKESKEDLVDIRDSIFKGYSYSGIKLAAVSKTNVKKIKKYVEENDIKNVVTVEEFKENKNNLAFRSLADLYVYSKYSKEINRIEEFEGNSREYPFMDYFYPKVAAEMKDISEFRNKMNKKYSSFYNLEEAITEVVNDIEGLAEFAEMKKHEIIAKIKKTSGFLSYFYPVSELIANTNGYHASLRFNNALLQLLHIYMVNMKLKDTTFVMCDEMQKPIDEAEYTMLLTEAKSDNSKLVKKESQYHRVNFINWSKEDRQAAFLINKYEILNNLNLTEWNL